MAQLIKIRVSKRTPTPGSEKVVSPALMTGFDIKDIVVPIRRNAANTASYFTARQLKGTTSGTAHNNGRVDYEVVESLASIAAQSEIISVLTVNSRRGVPMNSESMVFVHERISESLLPVEDPGGAPGNLDWTKFFYAEDGDVLPVEYIVEENIATIIPTYVPPTPPEALCVFMTYAQLMTAIGAETLDCGQQIKVIDRGDQGIIVTAISAYEVDPQAVRIMNVPVTYQPGGLLGGFVNLGIWHQGLAPAATAIAIWGAQWWQNIAGTNVNPPVDDVTLDPAEWTLIPKPAYSTVDTFYSQKIFDIIWDVANDWIEKQWDGSGNVFGIGYPEQLLVLGAFNYVDHSDWNYATKTGAGFYNNKCDGVLNNRVAHVFENRCVVIRNNVFDNAITYNEIDGNIEQCANTGPISFNKMTQSISGLDTALYGHGEMTYNSLKTPIASTYIIDITGSATVDLTIFSKYIKHVELQSTNPTETITDITTGTAGDKYMMNIESGLAVTFVNGAGATNPKCEGAINAVVDGTNGDFVEFEQTAAIIRQSNIGTY